MFKQLFETTKQGDPKVAAKILREKLRTADTPAHVSARAERVTFDEVAALLKADYQQKGNRTRKDMERRVCQLRDVFGGPWLAITEPRIERYKAERLAAGEPKATTNRRLADLRRMGKLGVRQKLVPSAPHVALFDESDNVREGFVEPAAFTALLAEIARRDPDVADGTEFAYNSAWRSAMVWAAAWMHCDLVLSEDGAEIVEASIRLPPASA